MKRTVLLPWLSLGLLSVASCATGPELRPAMTPGTFDGWHALPGGAWRWDGDVLVGTSPASEKRHGLLVSDARFADFEAHVEFRVLSGDSGFYFRIDEVGGTVGAAGFQAEVDSTLETGGLYETGGRAWVVKPDADAMASVYTPGEWAELSVRAVGRDVEVRVNGVVTATLRDDPGRTEGHLAFQLHGSQEMHVEYRGLAVREL